MLKDLEKAKARWGGASNIIDEWLRSRQQLLVTYCSLAGLSSKHTALPDANEISEFCTLLMDYCSSGHFGVYDKLVDDDTAGQQIKSDTYPKIANTTDKALAFSDTYSEAFSQLHASAFDVQLANLGEILEERFDLEDKLIQHMHQRRQNKASELRR